MCRDVFWGIALLFVASAAHAQGSGDAAEIYMGLKDADSGDKTVSAKMFYAMGYVRAVIDEGKGKIHCPPTTIQMSDYYSTVRLYIETWANDHPTETLRGYSPREFITEAVRSRWPCTKD